MRTNLSSTCFAAVAINRSRTVARMTIVISPLFTWIRQKMGNR